MEIKWTEDPRTGSYHPLVHQLCFWKTAKTTVSLSIVLLEHVYVLWFIETQKTGKFHQFVAYL